MGARILCVTDGLPSIVYSSVELARRLAAAGHRVAFSGGPDTRRLAEHHGLDFFDLEPVRYEEFLAADADTGVLHKLRTLKHRQRRARDSMTVHGITQTLRDVRPDLVLVNGEMHEHIIAASATGIPMALLNTFVSIWRRPGLPPPHHLARPGVGWRGTRMGSSLLWFGLRMRKWRRTSTLRTRRFGCDRVTILRQLARDAGFDLRHETDAGQWLIPFTYRRFPVLSLHALEFEFQHRPPQNVHFVGPMVLEDRVDRPMADDDRARLDAIFARRRQSRGERKLIYAGFGSAFSTDHGLLRRLVEAIAARAKWDLVISLAESTATDDLGRLPDGVFTFPWVPQLEVLRNADVAVTHGGINTADECVLNGVPMLVYCGFETDMGGTTARIVHHELGIAGDRRRDSGPVVREHIDRLLHEPRFARQLAQLRRQYATYEEKRAAEVVVASLLDSAVASTQ